MPDQTSEAPGNVPNASASFRTLPQDSEPFGNVPKAAESFRTVRNHSERTEQHTLTVREAARLFEQAGVLRTERSIINWCQPNHQGIARLDAFFDTNERKYFMTPQSVTAAIREEQAKQSAFGNTSAPNRERPNEPERAAYSEEEAEDTETLHLRLRDLEITNRVKDQFIGRLEKDRENFAAERERYVRQLMTQSHQIGQLETKLLQLGAPENVKQATPTIHNRFVGSSHHEGTDAPHESEADE